MKISVVSPSYNRENNVGILKYLPFVKVYVGESQLAKYIECNKEFKDNFVACPDETNLNIAKVRNFMLDNEFGNGADVVCMLDDDVSNVYKYSADEKTKFGYKKVELKKEKFLELKS